MLPEERKALILEYIDSQHAVTATELMQRFDASEATIRRDLTDMDKKGLIQKVHGGAVSLKSPIAVEYKVSERMDKNIDEKILIAKHAAGLIQNNDLVFLDAGTSTYHIIDYIDAPNVTFVTNAIMHAQKLAANGYSVFLTGGRLKATTEALIGSECYESILHYHFSIGFFGANAVNRADGFTTPDPEEAKIKECALSRTHSPYILCDHTKFDLTSNVRFSYFEDAHIITAGRLPKAYQKSKNITLLTN